MTQTMPDVDLWDDAPAEPDFGVKNGRYRYPAPPGWTGRTPKPSPTNPLGTPSWMRTSNLAGAFSDQRALQLWLERMTLRGLLANEGLLFDELAAVPDSNLTDERLEEFAALARTAAGADMGARKGTARHAVLEHYLDTGEIGGHRRMQLQMADLLAEMDRQEVDFIPGWSERVVWNSIAGGTMGRLDARVMCRRTGQEGVFDLKTQMRFWTYQEAAGQQACYDGAEWVWEGPPSKEGFWRPYNLEGPANSLIGRKGGWCEGKRVALLAHMPRDGGPVQIIEVDVEYGREVLATAARNVELRSRGKSVAPGRAIAGIRPA